MHIVAKFSEDSDSPLRVSRLSRETSPVPREITGRGYLPHYCVDADQQDAPSMYTSGTAPSSQTSAEPANAASNTSLAVYEDVHAAPCTQATSDDDAGGGIGCINIATLLSVWRFRALRDTDNIDSTDDLFMIFTIPVEESLIGQQSSLHELVFGNNY